MECKSNGIILGIVIICSIYVYEFVLFVLVVYYVFRVRKLLFNFNEIKYVIFIMYI